MNHTPEPWHWERESNGGYTVNTKAQSKLPYRQPEGIRVAYIAPDASAGAASIEAANAQRIVATINGCAGLNPAAYRACVEALKEAVKLYETVGAHFGYVPGIDREVTTGLLRIKGCITLTEGEAK